VHYTKISPSSYLGVIGPIPRSPHPKMWRFADYTANYKHFHGPSTKFQEIYSIFMSSGSCRDQPCTWIHNWLYGCVATA